MAVGRRGTEAWLGVGGVRPGAGGGAVLSAAGGRAGGTVCGGRGGAQHGAKADRLAGVVRVRRGYAVAAGALGAQVGRQQDGIQPVHWKLAGAFGRDLCGDAAAVGGSAGAGVGGGAGAALGHGGARAAPVRSGRVGGFCADSVCGRAGFDIRRSLLDALFARLHDRSGGAGGRAAIPDSGDEPGGGRRGAVGLGGLLREGTVRAGEYADGRGGGGQYVGGDSGVGGADTGRCTGGDRAADDVCGAGTLLQAGHGCAALLFDGRGGWGGD